MDYKSLIDFNKYTLAPAAAGFAYALEKFVPSDGWSRFAVLIMLLIIGFSALCGILLFAVATGAQHGDQNRKKRAEPWISNLGTGHAVLLFLGMLMLLCMLIPRVLAEPVATTTTCRCCTSP